LAAASSRSRADGRTAATSLTAIVVATFLDRPVYHMS